MIAQPVTIVPPEIKAPPAPTQSGQAVGTFVDHLASAAAQQSQTGSNASGSASTSATILSWHKMVVKSTATDSKTAANSTLSNAAAALLAQNALAGLNVAANAINGNRAANNNAVGSGTSTTNPNTLLSSTALGTGSLQVAATLGTGTAVQLTTPSSSQSAAQLANAAANPLGLSPTNTATTSAGTPTKANAAATLNLPANLVGQNQASAPAASPTPPTPAATALANQPSTAPTTPAGNQTALAATNLAANATNLPPVPTTPAAAPAQGAGAAPSNTPATSTSTAQAAATSGGANQPIPNATDLNARVVAGAATLAAQAGTAASAVANKLVQPRDPNAAVMPSAGTDEVPGTKGETPIGIAAPTSAAATNATISAPSIANVAHSFGVALEHASNPTQNDTSDAAANNAGQSPSTGDNANLPTDATATLATPQQTAPSNTGTLATTDMAQRPGLLAIPASEQVAINLKQAIANGTDEIHIQLKPASLGAIDVKLNVNHDGRLTAVISADRSDTLNLLKQDASSLQQSLQDAGFNADSSSLSFNLRSDTQSFGQNGTPQGNTTSQTAILTDDAPAKLAAYAPRQHSGTIDIQA